MSTSPSASAGLRNRIRRLAGASSDYDPLIEQAGNKRIVLLGEASHGTHEFYLERARITQRLIREKGFNLVAVEADWPDALRVHRYAQGEASDADADGALSGFRRFPAWMWRNVVVREFVEWLRRHNGEEKGGSRTGFYGMDLYSLHSSIAAVLDYLGTVDPAAAAMARERYSCFDHFGESPQAYGFAAGAGEAELCEDEVVRQLTEMQQRAASFLSRNGAVAKDEYFFAEQNARVIQNAEKYYRAMYRRRDISWNLRDTHMVETLDAMTEHARSQGQDPKLVVWAHNSHLGDARATEMGERGDLNVGQLVRERHGDAALLVGFSTYSGTVTAADEWGGDAELMNVRPALPGSYESLFHEVGDERFLIDLGDPEVRRSLDGPLLQRAIGVIYRPRTERMSHYFQCRLPEQFDWIIHVDDTSALEPLERGSLWDKGEIPETYPFKL